MIWACADDLDLNSDSHFDLVDLIYILHDDKTIAMDFWKLLIGEKSSPSCNDQTLQNKINTD